MLRSIFAILFASALTLVNMTTDIVTDLNTDYIRIQRHYDRYDGALDYHFLSYIESVIIEEEMQDKLSLAFMVALIETESQFEHHSESHAGAYGLCQIMPLTAKGINDIFGRNLDRKDMYDNVRLSVLYFKDLHMRYNDMETVVRFYNGGTNWREKSATERYYNAIMWKMKVIEKALKS